MRSANASEMREQGPETSCRQSDVQGGVECLVYRVFISGGGAQGLSLRSTAGGHHHKPSQRSRSGGSKKASSKRNALTSTWSFCGGGGGQRGSVPLEVAQRSCRSN